MISPARAASRPTAHALAAAVSLAVVATFAPSPGGPTMARAQSTGPQTTGAEITPVGDVVRKLNLAGRQHMLTQYIAKASCFVKLGVERDRHQQERLSAQFLFEQTLADLRTGSPVQELRPETDAEILAALDAVAGPWKAFQAAVNAGDLKAIARDSEATSNAVQKIIDLIVRKRAPSSGADPAMMAAIVLAGAERGLIQRAVKSFCYAAAGEGTDEARIGMMRSIDAFEAAIGKLRTGEPETGIAPPPVAEVSDQLTALEEDWGAVRTILMKVAGGGKPTPEDIALVVTENTRLLEEMNGIVELYVALAGG